VSLVGGGGDLMTTQILGFKGTVSRDLFKEEFVH
jgi:hypothetical protein